MSPLPQRSSGWILLITRIREEAHEKDMHRVFERFGSILNTRWNYRSGINEGYALVEYAEYSNALAAKQATDGTEILAQRIKVDCCFVEGP